MVTSVITNSLHMIINMHIIQFNDILLVETGMMWGLFTSGRD